VEEYVLRHGNRCGALEGLGKQAAVAITSEQVQGLRKSEEGSRRMLASCDSDRSVPEQRQPLATAMSHRSAFLTHLEPRIVTKSHIRGREEGSYPGANSKFAFKTGHTNWKGYYVSVDVLRYILCCSVQVRLLR
jgi:hypothetical protein